jgi:Protein of unknown function (DUF1553)/Protein of unknown function (DUF1549)
VPQVQHTNQTRTPIDAFLLALLEPNGLTFSTPADRVTLIRRLYLDLLGLLPSPGDVDAFLSDHRADAYERLVDRLLASPHFGERWGRHWLDVVGYADTVGFDVDATTIILAEGKWRYRDYVIDAFNRDKPYDRFVTEQLAGDELTNWRRAPALTPQMRECLIATGFLRTARDESHEPESNIPLIHHGVLQNTVEIVGNSLLGLTLNCCRCHNHKFDPIPQKDYYQLMALFTPAYNPTNWKPVYPWKPQIKDRGLPDVSFLEQAAIDRHNRDIDQQVRTLQSRLAEIRRRYETRLFDQKLQALPEAIRADTRTAIQVPTAERNEVQKYLASKFDSVLTVKPTEVAAALSAADRVRIDQIKAEMAHMNASRQRYGKLQALYDVGPPPRTHLLRRGNYETPGPEVSPGFLSVLCDSPEAAVLHEPTPVGETSGRRSAFARWLTAPGSRASALLARVMVNRVWQHLFGQGLVPTPENFGTSGEPPTHPELLEWLSSEFLSNGWRIKPLIRLILCSTTYQQASHYTAENPGTRTDPGNQLLWRMRLRRLDAEAIRDDILAASGRFDPSMGGPPISLQARSDGMVVVDERHLARPADATRRSVYLLTRRAYNLSLLTVFDEPLVAVNCPCRDASAVPLQSLTMLNDAFVSEQAQHLARRVSLLAGQRGQKAIEAAFRLALVRRPNASELAACEKLLERQAATYQTTGMSADDAEQKALAQLCHTLLNTSEFLYAE